MNAQAAIAEAQAVRDLAAAAETFVTQSTRAQRLRNMGGLYARALKSLLAAARVFAKKSDEAWAAEVAALRIELRTAYELHQRSSITCRERAGVEGECVCPEFHVTRKLLEDCGR